MGSKMLTSLRYRVLTADDGVEAIAELLANDAIDAVLMDQNMPRMDGTTATREIRRLEGDGKLRRRPILAVSAVVSPEAQAEYRAAGMDGFLPKPLSLATLETHLGMWLGGGEVGEEGKRGE